MVRFSGTSISRSGKSDIFKHLEKSEIPSYNYNLEVDLNAIYKTKTRSYNK